MVKKTAIYLGIVLFAFLCIRIVSNSSEASLMVLDNSKTQAESEILSKEPVVSGISEGFQKVSESDELELYVNQSTLAIQLKDKKTGFIYSSIQEELEGLNDLWINFMYSGITIEYVNKDKNLVRLPLSSAKANMEISYRNDGFQADITYSEGFSLSVNVTLVDDYVTVSIADDSIQETNSNNSLENIYLYPFLGATKGNSRAGYLFVPDGSGALIRTNQESVIASSPYIKRIYGKDMGIGDFTALWSRSNLYDSQQIYMPVYGAVYEAGSQGIAAIIEQGDAYADIEAYVNGIATPYNFITSKFIYRETYKQLLDNAGATMIANQKDRNHTNIATRYTFLRDEKANYIGIAQTYQEYLIEQGVLHRDTDVASQIPMKIEFLGAEQKSQLIGESTEVMTSLKDMDMILSELLQKNLKNLSVNIRGFSKQGASAAAPTQINFQSKVGTQKEWLQFIKKYQEAGLELGFYTDFNKGYEGGGSYQAKRDAAQAINKILIETYDNDMFQYLSPKFSVSQADIIGKDLKKLGLSTMSIDTMGYKLYSNWNKKSKISRSEAMMLYQNLDIEDMKLAFYSPNSYLWNITDAIYDIPVSSSQYLIFTDTIPFMQIVLKGYIPYYKNASNFNADPKLELLKMIEFGTYPSYFITNEDSINLFDTPSGWLYTSAFASWKDQMISEYEVLNSVLSQVEGSKIKDRKIPAQGIVVMEYDNGTGIVINYNQKNYDYQGVTVEAEGFAVIHTN